MKNNPSPPFLIYYRWRDRYHQRNVFAFGVTFVKQPHFSCSCWAWKDACKQLSHCAFRFCEHYVTLRGIIPSDPWTIPPRARTGKIGLHAAESVYFFLIILYQLVLCCKQSQTWWLKTIIIYLLTLLYVSNLV